jgi:ribose transport system substrate-binding protein
VTKESKSRAGIRLYSCNLETVSRACAVLREFGDDGQTLSLIEMMKRTGMERTICFRMLHTLEKEGFLRSAESRRYASNLQIRSGKQFRIGYASQGNNPFSAAVSQGLRMAARKCQLDLIESENNYSLKAALRNVELLVKERVDIAIEFQVFDRITAKISTLFQEAGIPVITIDIPEPGAVFFGVDNYKAGRIAGRTLLRTAQRAWSGNFDELILLDAEIAGRVPHLRLWGAEEVLCSSLHGGWLTTRLDSRGEFIRSFEMTRKYLRYVPKRRTLLCGVNDPAVLGALRAFEELGRGDLCRAVGFNGTAEGRRELRRPNSWLVGTVGFFPENYGNNVLALVLDMLHHKIVSPANYTPVQLLTPQNVDRFYPKDIFEHAEAVETQF